MAIQTYSCVPNIEAELSHTSWVVLWSRSYKDMVCMHFKYFSVDIFYNDLFVKSWRGELCSTFWDTVMLWKEKNLKLCSACCVWTGTITCQFSVLCWYLYQCLMNADAYMFCRCFFSVFFSVRHRNTRQPFLGTAEWIFMKLLPNDSGENVVSNVVPTPQIILWG